MFQIKQSACIHSSAPVIKKQTVLSEDIAIIGLSARVGDANNYEQFWEKLKRGEDLIRAMPSARKEWVDHYLQTKGVHQAQYKQLAYMNSIDEFDYSFFKLSPKEASIMDPSQRLFMQSAVEAMEDAGYGGDRLRGTKTGVFVGYADNQDYSYQRIIHDLDPEAIEQFPTSYLNSMIPGRLAYILDLKGPSVVLDTACSSSLAAIHYACKSIINGDCDMALSGGVKVHFVPVRPQLELGIASKSERARSFDNDADGTGGGEGVFSILLKPYRVALQDKDQIYAVIKGSSLNQDGTSVSITAPNARSQEQLIVDAWKDAGVDPESISYIEAHGTGTRLGDPIEINAIEQAFKRYTDRRQFCGIGSVKTNVGHLDHAAGMVGLVKALLSLKNKQLVPNVHFTYPNEEIRFIDSPVFVVDKLQPWEHEGHPLRCGVSSFGISGTNCHLILEEAPVHLAETQYEYSAEKMNLCTISAKSKDSLIKLVQRNLEHLENKADINIEHFCYTTNIGRGHYSHRLIIQTDGLADLCQKMHLFLVNPDKDLEREGIYSNINPEHNAELSRGPIDQLCSNYIAALPIDWNIFYGDRINSTICLPTYVFEDKRCWVEPSAASRSTLRGEIPFYTSEWKATPLLKLQTNQGTVLLYAEAPGDLTSELEQELRKQGREVITVTYGHKLELEENYPLTVYDDEDYEKLLHKLSHYRFTDILYITSNNISIDSKESLWKIWSISRQILKHKFSWDVNFMFVTAHTSLVTGDEHTIHTHQGLLVGAVKAMLSEHNTIDFKMVDVGDGVDASQLIMEMNEMNYTLPMIAYRSGIRYGETLATLRLEEVEEDSTTIKRHGVYVITGGTGNVGIEMCHYLTSVCNEIRIVLLQRSLPDCKVDDSSEAWQMLASHHGYETWQRAAARGASIEIMQVDITSGQAVENAFQQIRKLYGGINGILHCAGTAVGEQGSKPFIEQSKQEISRMLSVKVNGTQLLDQCTRQDNLDFLLLCSSAITISGGMYAGGYLAANAYMDAYADFRNRDGLKTIAVNWPKWVFRQEDVVHEQDNQLFLPIQPHEARAGLTALLNKRVSRAVIGRLNWDSHIHQISELFPYRFSKGLQHQLNNHNHHSSENTASSGSKISIKGTEHPTRMEMELCWLWGELLGLKEIGVNESFMDLGGDSILAIRLEIEMEKRNWKADNSAVYEYDTISLLAKHIENKLSHSGGEN